MLIGIPTTKYPLSNYMKEQILSVFMILLMFVSLTIEAEDETTNQSIEAFSKLKSLVGVWTKSGSPQDNFRIEFSLTARDTVLVETWFRNGHVHSLTLYHQDIDKLLATHYCPQGNQPRLSLTPDSSSNVLSFEFLDATNLASINDSHQHSLRFKIEKSKDSVLVREESYLDGSGEHEFSLTLKRVISKHTNSAQPEQRK